MEYLKIKDDVDLKELEKYGFYKTEDFYMWDSGKDYTARDMGYSEVINPEFGLRDDPINNIYVWSNRYIESDTASRNGVAFSTDILLVLFDLIQAGLVEKVVE